MHSKYTIYPPNKSVGKVRIDVPMLQIGAVGERELWLVYCHVVKSQQEGDGESRLAEDTVCLQSHLVIKHFIQVTQV